MSRRWLASLPQKNLHKEIGLARVFANEREFRASGTGHSFTLILLPKPALRVRWEQFAHADFENAGDLQ